MVGGSLTSGVLLAAHSAAPAGAVQPHQQPPIQQALCVLRCCGELLAAGERTAAAARRQPVMAGSAAVCHLSCQCHVSQQSAVSSLHACLLTPDFLEQTDEPQAVGIWDLGIGLGILSPLNI